MPSDFPDSEPYAIMPAVYNWLPVMSAPLIDRKGFSLLDAVYPNQPFKEIHMVGPKQAKFELQFTDVLGVETVPDWTTFRKLKSEDSTQSETYNWLIK